MTTNDVLAYFKKRIKAISRVIKDKTTLQKLYTIPKGPLDERCDERVETKINVFLIQTNIRF
jgi:hypothetical protein